MKILDSDHCIAIMREEINPQQWIRSDEILAVTTISVGEITHGAYKSYDTDRNMGYVNTLLSSVRVLPFDENAARQFGWLKAFLEKKGMKLAIADLQIAAITLTAGAILVTHNQKHFRRIPNLVLEDWRA